MEGHFLQALWSFHQSEQSPLPKPNTMLFSLAKLTLLAAFIFPLYVGSLAGAQCTNPVIRREWRKLSVSERADWIRAVNVSEIISLCAT
jgi:hypothetical protein